MEQGPFLEAAGMMVDQCWDKVGTRPAFDLLRNMLHAASARDPEGLKPLLVEVLEQLPASATKT
jgi:hypothetical protein